MHPVQSGKGKMYRLSSNDRIIPLNPHIDPTIYILIVTHKEIGENRGKGGLHGYTIHLIIEVTLEQGVSFVVHPRSDLHKYLYYRFQVLMLHYELKSSTVFVICFPFEFGNTKAHAWFCNYSYTHEHSN